MRVCVCVCVCVCLLKHRLHPESMIIISEYLNIFIRLIKLGNVGSSIERFPAKFFFFFFKMENSLQFGRAIKSPLVTCRLA